METKLTRVERQILKNQNKILKLLDEDNKDDYNINIEILNNGIS